MVPSPPVLTARIVAGRVPPGNQFWRLNVGGRTDCRRRPLKFVRLVTPEKSRRNKKKKKNIFIYFNFFPRNHNGLLLFVSVVYFFLESPKDFACVPSHWRCIDNGTIISCRDAVATQVVHCRPRWIANTTCCRWWPLDPQRTLSAQTPRAV